MILNKNNSPLFTDKDVYEYVMYSLKEQGGRSVDIDEQCLYRGHTSTLQDEIREKLSLKYDDEETLYSELIYELRMTPPNAKCAAGHLIADENYDSIFENQTLDYDIFTAIKNSNPKWNPGPYAFEMVRLLQDIHDSNSFEIMIDMYERLENKFTSNKNYLGDSKERENNDKF